MMVNDLSPIPQPSEIVAFLIRGMSHVDDANESGQHKELQRLRQGKPLSPEAANDLLRKHLQNFHEANGNLDSGVTDFMPLLQEYTQLCLALDCGVLPPGVVREVFDRVAFGLFQRLFRDLLPATGVSPKEILGSPQQATQLLWSSRVKDFGLKTLATEIECKFGLRKGVENWEASIARWSKGEHEPQITTILSLMKHWDRKFARTLLASRLYRRYCDLSLVDCRKHIQGYEIPFSIQAIQSEITELTRTPPHQKTCDLTAPQLNAVNEIVQLTDPRRKKAKGENCRVETLFGSLDADLNGQPRLAGLNFYRGLYYAQMGNLEDALAAFDHAANWFQFRSAVQLKSCLHHLLNISLLLGKRRIYSKWEGFCKGFGLDVDVQDAQLAVARDFPELFPEATRIFKSHPGSDYVIFVPDWENRPVDLRNPNRIIKGYGRTPTPQLALFANLGQIDKVKQLLDAGASTNKLDKNGGSALLSALQGGNDACFWALLPLTPIDVINARTKGGKSVLHEAIWAGKVDCVRGLLEQKADTEIRGKNDATALCAVIEHFWDPDSLVRTMVQSGFTGAELPAVLKKTTSPFPTYESAAQSSSNYSQEELALLQTLSEQMLQGDRKKTRQVTLALLEYGADVNAEIGQAKLTPFLYAAEIGNSWLLKILVDHGADIRARDSQGGTALSRLHFFGHSRLAADFLSWVSPSDRIWLREAAMQVW